MAKKCDNVFTPWNFICFGTFLGLVIAIALVVNRNVGAARMRRDTVLVSAVDISEDPHNFTTEKLPKDDRFMCSIGNGHLATDVFSETVYMNGFYNGEKGLSHRARIPAWCNVRLNSTIPGNSALKPLYTLDTKTGTFFVHVEREWSVVDQRIYAHRYYTRAIVNQIVITPKQNAHIRRDYRAQYVDLSFLHGPDSKDVDFEKPQIMKLENRLIWSSCGRTNKKEDRKYQDVLSQVCAYWTYVPAHLVVPRRGKIIYTFVMTVDRERIVAEKEMINVLQQSDEGLYRKHRDEWDKVYQNGKIEIEGNLQLEKIVNGIWYYFHSSLPPVDSNQKHGLFYGLSPCGLSRGDEKKDYEGHNFWDTELWMFPSILLLSPYHAELLLKYRIQMMLAASDLAKVTKNEGIRYPWESAFTGLEVTQPCCPEVAEFEHHITGCIAFAVRQYLSMVESENWLKNSGCTMVFDMAAFWASRVEFNETTRQYDIKNVMGPDEEHFNISNSAFTNVVAGYSLYLGEYTACLCKNFTWPRKQKWTEIAQHLVLPYDPVLDYHPQFDDYQRPEMIKQADVALLGFPLQYKMNMSTRANDLAYYESVTRENGPAMTWSMHTIGHLQIGNSVNAAEMFNRSYQDYVREPFKIWTEYRKPKIGSVNFHTGMGGFLQAVLFGYAGIGINLDRLEIHKPQPLPQSDRLKISGIKYFGIDMTLDIIKNNVTLLIKSIKSEREFELAMLSNKITLRSGMKLILHGDGPFEIRRKIMPNCPLPLDVIGVKNVNTELN